jgi:hypothetical protein
MKKTLLIGAAAVLVGIVIERMTAVSDKVPGLNSLRKA